MMKTYQKGLLLVLVLSAVLIWGYNTSRVKTVQFEGLTKYSEENMKGRLCDNLLTRNTFGLLLYSRFREKKIPFIERYEVEYVDQNTVQVRVYEKIITGCVQIMGKYMFFDKDGIVVESSDGRIDGIPLIVGLKFNEIVLYQPLTVQKQSLFSTILTLTKLLTEYRIPASRVVFDGNFEVTLDCGDIQVLLGKRDDYDVPIAALRHILDAAAGRSGTFDMRAYSKENQEVILK